MLDRIEDGVRHIRQFTADASHELSTPIAIIRAAAEVTLVNPAANDRVYREALQRILREAQHASRLLEDLLYLARAESGAERRGHEPIDLDTHVARACGQIMPLAESKGVTVTFHTRSHAQSIVGDDDQLRRLWLILLDNGLKYTPSGGTVAVEIGVTPDDRPFCKVADTGIGIVPEHLPKLFERFYRVEKARTSTRRGAGLGLAIALEIATRHGAIIDVESQPARGSVFTTTFPQSASFRESSGCCNSSATPHS